MNRKGMTLIELLVALSVSSILVAGVYRTFVSQQHTFSVQDQVVDMQQNVRLAINRMTRELRMANFGSPIYTNSDGSRNNEFFNHGGMVVNDGTNNVTFNDVINPGAGGTSITVVEGFQTLIPTTLSLTATAGSNSIFVNDVSSFDTTNKNYISINGLESHKISAIAGKELQFLGWDKLINDHQIGAKVYVVQAITYSIGQFEGKSCLLRNENLGLGQQPVAENIENLQFTYFDANGNPTVNPSDIRMIQVSIVARSDKTDADLAKVSDGFRRRTLTSNIKLRNLGLP
jgi:prepilin-type N-terminal cleavage/methylation domain-containing protein